MGRRDEIIALLAQVNLPLDDDDIGDRLGIDRHYVNSICRDLVSEGLATRSEGPDGKLRTHLAEPNGEPQGPAESIET